MNSSIFFNNVSIALKILIFNWEHELSIVEQTLTSLTPQKRSIAEFWGSGEASSKWSPLILELSRKYQYEPPYIARILAYFHDALNDAFVMSWYFKYLWDVARPNQYDKKLSTVLTTPRFPAYPSAHATVAGCAEMVLNYFFPQESARFKNIAIECALSRLYASVHFKVDNDEGLRLGRQIGNEVVSLLKAQNI